MNKQKRFEERAGNVELMEAVEGAPRRIRVNDAIVAGVVNANGRRYPAEVVAKAVEEVRSHLHESAGQARVIEMLGEAEHPSDKSGRPNLLEVVVKWDDISFDGRTVSLGGRILETSKGKDILALMEGGVKPGVSLRGYGESKLVKEGKEKIEDVQWLKLNGFDLVTEPSFVNQALLESKSNNQGEEPEENIMSEELAKQLEETNKQKAELQKQLEEATRKAEEGAKAQATLEEAKRKEAIETAIEEATKELPFGEKMNKVFVESFKGQKFADVEAVKAFAESQRKQFSTLAAAGLLQGIGFSEGKIQVLGDVLERETGTPEFGRVAFELTESVRKSEMRPQSDLRKREDRGALFTLQLLEKFDKMYKRQLMAEAKEFNEAELTTDLNLPYSVSRAIIAEAFPNLVAANVFDVGVIETSPTRIYYEAFSGETGYTVAVTDEVEALGAEGTWYDLANKNITPGTVVVTSNPAGTTYTEGTDYIIDYENGKILALAAGSIDANDVLVDYSYNAIRKGENAAIEQAKTTLSYQTIEAAADRLATDITDETIKFSRSQLGWDAVGRTMANLIREIRRDIDRRLIEKGVAAALSVASNSGGTWDISDSDESDLVAKLGAAAVKVGNRFYEPTFILASLTNAERLSNWTGFQRDGFPNALLQASGFQNMIVKGLPVFASPLMRDNWFLVGNREVVMHRVMSPMTIKGPYAKYSSSKLIAAEQYYAEEYNASLAPIGGKAAYVATQA